MRQRHLDHRLLSKLFFRLLPYQVLLLVISAVNGIVDSLFASNCIGESAMSAIGFYSPFNHFLFAVSIMLVSGSQLLSGEAMGKNEMKSVEGFFSTDIILSVILSGLTALLLILFAASDMTRLLVQEAGERQAMNMYIIGQAVGIPALVVGQQLFSFLSLENKTRRTMAASLLCIAVNIAMDVLLVVIFRAGTLGLGLASSLGRWAFCLIMAEYYAAGRSHMKFSPRGFSLRHSLSIMLRGYSGALSRFVEMFRGIIVNILILRFVGSVGLSAFAAVNSVMAVFWPVPFGMVAVSRMLFGFLIGEEDRRSLTDVMRIALIRGGLLQCGISLILVLLAVPFTYMFYHNPADPVYHMTYMGFLLMPLCMPLAVFSLIYASYAQAMQKKVLFTLLPILDGAVGVSVVSALLIPAMKMNGLYIANILNGVLCLIFVAGYARKSRGKAPKNIEDLMLIPDELGVAESERIDIEINEIAHVRDVSRQVVDFCSERGISPRRAYYAGLSLEEMAGNVVEHGFTKDKKKHVVMIRVVHKDGDIIMRLLDDCVAFDPLERVNMMEEGDVCSNIGIRIVNRIAKEVQYQNLLGLNVLTVRI